MARARARAPARPGRDVARLPAGRRRRLRPAAAAASKTAAAVSASTSVKASFLGGLLGSAVTISLAAAVFYYPRASSVSEGPPPVVTIERRAGATAEIVLPNVAPTPLDGVAPNATAAVVPPAPTPKTRATSAASATSTTNEGLLREASYVADARRALLDGNPEAALRAVRAARNEGRSLEPEGLSIEARALRALNRPADAARVEWRLRSRYPHHALAR